MKETEKFVRRCLVILSIHTGRRDMPKVCQSKKHIHTHTHTHTHGKWIRSCRLRLCPQPHGWAPVHYAGAKGRAKQSPGAWPGARTSTNCNANCGVVTRRPTKTPVVDGLCRSQGLLPPKAMTRYSFILLSRERQLCMSFLPKEIMP